MTADSVLQDSRGDLWPDYDCRAKWHKNNNACHFKSVNLTTEEIGKKSIPTFCRVEEGVSEESDRRWPSSMKMPFSHSVFTNASQRETNCHRIIGFPKESDYFVPKVDTELNNTTWTSVGEENLTVLHEFPVLYNNLNFSSTSKEAYPDSLFDNCTSSIFESPVDVADFFDEISSSTVDSRNAGDAENSTFPLAAKRKLDFSNICGQDSECQDEIEPKKRKTAEKRKHKIGKKNFHTHKKIVNFEPLSKEDKRIRRDLANARERARVQRMADAYQILQKCVPDSVTRGRGKKLDILKAAIRYIETLTRTLRTGESASYLLSLCTLETMLPITDFSPSNSVNLPTSLSNGQMDYHLSYDVDVII